MIQETEPITGENIKEKKNEGRQRKKKQKKNRSQQGFKQEFRRACREKKQREKVLDGNKKGVTLKVGERRER